MIQIKKPKYEHDNYCACCRKPFEDSMEISFSHKNYNDSINITLCGKCREELMEALGRANTNSALDHIHNVVRDDACRRGYEQGKADSAPKWVPFTAETAPKEDGLYIIKYKTKTGGKAISADRYSTAYGEWFINHNDAVIAWTPAPKEEGEQSGKTD